MRLCSLCMLALYWYELLCSIRMLATLYWLKAMLNLYITCSLLKQTLYTTLFVSHPLSHLSFPLHMHFSILFPETHVFVSVFVCMHTLCTKLSYVHTALSIAHAVDTLCCTCSIHSVAAYSYCTFLHMHVCLFAAFERTLILSSHMLLCCFVTHMLAFTFLHMYICSLHSTTVACTL